jgi:hypothetical protein
MKKLLLASLVLGTGVTFAACSAKQTPTTSTNSVTPTMTQTEQGSAPSIAVGEPNPGTATMQEDKVTPATQTDSLDDLNKEISSYSIEQEQFN